MRVDSQPQSATVHGVGGRADYAGTGTRARGAGRAASTFSFSLGAGLAFTVWRALTARAVAWSRVADTTRRCSAGEGEGEGPDKVGLADAERERTGARAAGVGVPATDIRLVTGAGGPIDPVARGAGFDVELLRALLRRELFPRAAILPPLTLPPSVPASEITDGGREPILGVVKTAESRRWCPIFEGCAGVDPAVPRTPMRRLSCSTENIRQ
jgi:hypothetical protein